MESSQEKGVLGTLIIQETTQQMELQHNQDSRVCCAFGQIMNSDFDEDGSDPLCQTSLTVKKQRTEPKRRKRYNNNPYKKMSDDCYSKDEVLQLMSEGKAHYTLYKPEGWRSKFDRVLIMESNGEFDTEFIKCRDCDQVILARQSQDSTAKQHSEKYCKAIKGLIVKPVKGASRRTKSYIDDEDESRDIRSPVDDINDPVEYISSSPKLKQNHIDEPEDEEVQIHRQRQAMSKPATNLPVSPEKKTNKRKDYIGWDEYFMGVARLSSLRSKDPNTQVGACIVNRDKRIVGIGYNGMPTGCSDESLPWDRKGPFLDTKYAYICHAEMNAIMNKNSSDLKDCTMYVDFFPCNECAKLIIQAKIKRVVYMRDKYKDEPAFIASRKLLKMANVDTTQFIPKRKSINISFDLEEEPLESVKETSKNANV